MPTAASVGFSLVVKCKYRGTESVTSLEARTIDGAGPEPRILRPGVRSLPVGMERYRVAGGGSAVFRVYEGDRLQVVNVEGRQPGEVLACLLYTSPSPRD